MENSGETGERGERILTVDIGNTSMKVTLFEGERIIASLAGRDADPEMVSMMWVYYDVDGVAFSCVGEDRHGIGEGLGEMWGDRYVGLSPNTPLPLEVRYGTRDTLGADRLATAVGASAYGSRLLVVDAGTAVTCDLVCDGVFLGGNISPGLRLRFGSLHEQTACLPLVEPEGDLPIVGTDTATAIRAGVVGGLVGEISVLYRKLLGEYPGLKLLLTGGDGPMLENLLRREGIDCVADASLLAKGLVAIYRYAVSHKGEERAGDD